MCPSPSDNWKTKLKVMSVKQVVVMDLLFALMFIGPEWAVAQIAGPVYQVIDLGTLGSGPSYAYGINNSGQVVGCFDTSDGLLRHAFSYSYASMQDLVTLGVSEGGACWS